MYPSNRTLLLAFLAASITFGLFQIAPYGSEWVEKWYSRGVFGFFRNLWDYTLGFSPIGFIYLFIIFVLTFIVLPFFAKIGRRKAWHFFAKRILLVLALSFVAFYWLWAFNYKRVPLDQNLGLGALQPDSSFVYSEYKRVTDSLLYLKQSIIATDHDINGITENALRKDLEKTLSLLGLPGDGRVRVRKVRPKGTLLRISTAGVYLPFTGEGHIDAGLHPITHPFTMMHEMSHGYGWTGEDACNFLALLAAINSSSIGTRYSGYFGYWRYLRSQLYKMDRRVFDEKFRKIPKLIEEDYEDILRYANRYPDILPQIRDLFYDSYLKSHGISSGLINYSQMIILSYRWQEKKGSLLLNDIIK